MCESFVYSYEVYGGNIACQSPVYYKRCFEVCPRGVAYRTVIRLEPMGQVGQRVREREESVKK